MRRNTEACVVATLPWTSGREAVADSSDFIETINYSLHSFCGLQQRLLGNHMTALAVEWYRRPDESSHHRSDTGGRAIGYGWGRPGVRSPPSFGFPVPKP